MFVLDDADIKRSLYVKQSEKRSHDEYGKADRPLHGWIFAQFDVNAPRSFFKPCLGHLQRSFFFAYRLAQARHSTLHLLDFATRLQHQVDQTSTRKYGQQ